ncbi:hypothetical protein CLOM_g3193 [Closterium sp. NIES-68]|nr:hypothetical protein CLOM_g3193 [Closterium sp. NIES-68]GJP76335.1 hypothetical protein CLOP_g6796 [Closterium sp. NIES-67]
MLAVGQKLLREHAPDAKEYHFGFHRPPFNSVDHLHLHCFALPFNSWWHQQKYTPRHFIPFFMTPDALLERLGKPAGIAE